MPSTLAALLIPVALFALVAQPLPAKMKSKDIIAYVFVKDRVLDPSEIAATKLTRINYAFANLINGEVVEGFPHDAGNFAVLTGLKRMNPALEVLVSVGGWTWSGAFSDASLTKESRKRFVDSAVRFVRKYSLDGLDIDWEYPGLIGNGNRFRPEDKTNYTALLKELRARFDKEEKATGHHLITSIATGASDEVLQHTEMNLVAKYVDSVNLMAYDYYEPTDDKIAGHHAPLHTNPADPKHISAEESVKGYLAAGVPADKLVLGVPFYGHAWSEVGETNHGLFQPAKGANIPSSYHDVVGSLLSSGYTRYWDPIAAAPYLYNSATHTFVSYEDVESITGKARYIVEHHLAGVMFWDYHGDSNGALLDALDTVLMDHTNTAKGTTR